MIADFALRLICGMSLMWTIMPRQQVTSGFFRIQMLVVLGLSVLASLSMGTLGDSEYESAPLLSARAGMIGSIGLAVLAFAGSLFWTLERRRVANRIVYAVAAVSTVLLVGTTGPAISMTLPLGALNVLSELSSAAVLGAAMTAMLLGHWYLTAPTMSIDPLSRLNLYLGAAVVLRLLLSGLGLVFAAGEIDRTLQWVWLALRWACILGLLLVVWMVWRILKYRNTQAATGVLFVGVILSLIGELTATLLERESGIPF